MQNKYLTKALRFTHKTSALTLVITAIFCCHWGTDDNTSIDGSSKIPSINFSGFITDNTESNSINHNPFKAEYIQIGNKVSQCPLYAIPAHTKNEQYDPTTNIVFVDLVEIAKITIPLTKTEINSEHDEPIIYTFNNKPYVKIEITSKGTPPVTNSYMIEQNKKITCAELNPAGPIERELSLSAIREIIITGYQYTPHVELEQKNKEKTKKPEEQAHNKQLAVPAPAPASTQDLDKNPLLNLPPIPKIVQK